MIPERLDIPVADRDLTGDELLHLFFAGVDEDQLLVDKLAEICHFIAAHTPFKTVVIIAKDQEKIMGMGNINGIGDIPAQLDMVERYLTTARTAKTPVLN